MGLGKFINGVGWIFLFFLVCVCSVYSEVDVWNCSSSNNFSNSSCWSLGRVPALDDGVVFNGSGFGNVTVFFAEVNGDLNVSNVTLFVWNASRDLVGTNTTVVNSAYALVNLSLTLPFEGEYFWNYYAVYDTNNGVLSENNFTAYYFEGVSVHDFTGLPMTISGWTSFEAMITHSDLYNDARVVFVNESFLPELNTSKRVVMRNITYEHPIIKKDGADCTTCQNVTYNTTTKELEFMD